MIIPNRLLNTHKLTATEQLNDKLIFKKTPKTLNDYSFY